MAAQDSSVHDADQNTPSGVSSGADSEGNMPASRASPLLKFQFGDSQAKWVDFAPKFDLEVQAEVVATSTKLSNAYAHR